MSQTAEAQVLEWRIPLRPRRASLQQLLLRQELLLLSLPSPSFVVDCMRTCTCEAERPNGGQQEWLESGATAEAARRSGEARLLADEEAAALSQRQRRKKRNMLVLQVLVGLSLIATLFTTAVVVMHLGE